VSYVEMISITF